MQVANRFTNGISNDAVSTMTPITSVTESSTSPLINTAIPTLTATPFATATPAATQTSSTVMVSAVKGNLFIRRGPDMAFNPVGALMDGQSAIATGRDPLSKWLQIPIPGQDGKTGWVSIQTVYSSVTGDVASLPEVTPTVWPALAFIQNCTSDQMEVDPGAIVLPSYAYFPDNRIQINPGIYTVHDTSVSGSPEVMNVEIKEGSEIDVIRDGNGNKSKCP